MKVEEFDYYLPEELIAQTPLPERTASRLLVVDRKTGELTDTHFYDIINYLVPGDVLVLNNTKVLPARIFGRKTDTGANIEVLLLKDHGTHWEALVRPARRVKPGTVLDFSGLFQGEILAKDAEGLCKIRFHYEGIFLNLLEKLGKRKCPSLLTSMKNSATRTAIRQSTRRNREAPRLRPPASTLMRNCLQESRIKA